MPRERINHNARLELWIDNNEHYLADVLGIAEVAERAAIETTDNPAAFQKRRRRVLADLLKEDAEELLESEFEDCEHHPGFADMLAQSALEDIDWPALADHYLAKYDEQKKDEKQ
jgi:hypothetical protein